jgi:hypothetical protein
MECPQTAPIGLIGIFLAGFDWKSYDLRTSGIPRAFSGGIRPGNAVRLQLRVKLTYYSGYNKLNGLVGSEQSQWTA